MFGLEDVVQGRIKLRIRGKKISFAIDAWTEDGTHFVAVIAFTETEKFLLCFSVLSDESDMSSDAIIELLDVVLDTYEIDIAQLCFFVCDHASVKVAIAKKTKVPMIGCASHRFNLAVQELIRKHSDLLDKVHLLMGKLNTIKNRHHLHAVDALMPVVSNVTRWSSTFAMIDCYFRIYNKLDQVDDRLVDFILSPRENVRLKALHDDLRNFESVNKKLQSTTTTLLYARVLFDHVIKHYPSTAEKLSPTASLVKFPDFENCVIKLLAGKAANLSRQERTVVAKLLSTTINTPPNSDDSAPKKRSFAEEALCSEVPISGAPHSLHWIPRTSNDVERIFSRAGIVFSRLRRSLNPTTLETVLFLQYNRSLWDASAVAETVENTRKKQRVV